MTESALGFGADRFEVRVTADTHFGAAHPAQRRAYHDVVDTDRCLADRVRFLDCPVLRAHGPDAWGSAVPFPKRADVSRARVDSMRHPPTDHLDLAVPVHRSLSAKRVIRALPD
jgi:hypothetical protein